MVFYRNAAWFQFCKTCWRKLKLQTWVLLFYLLLRIYFKKTQSIREVIKDFKASLNEIPFNPQVIIHEKLMSFQSAKRLYCRKMVVWRNLSGLSSSRVHGTDYLENGLLVVRVRTSRMQAFTIDLRPYALSSFCHCHIAATSVMHLCSS